MDSTRLPTNLRTLFILEIIAGSDEALSPTQVAKLIGLPKQTVHRLCTTLVDEGFLMRDASGNKLRPSRRSRSFAAGILNVSRDHIARHQILLEVAKKVGETVNFVMPEDDGMSYKDRVETDWPFRVQLPVGSNVPFHCTASGKCFLASLKGKERANMVNALLLDPVTANTICDPDILLKELKTISKQGYATDNEEFMEGMVAVAVPVSGPNRKFLAALAFHAPAMRLDITEAISKKDILVQGAEKLSRLFFEHAEKVSPSSSSMEHNE